MVLDALRTIISEKFERCDVGVALGDDEGLPFVSLVKPEHTVVHDGVTAGHRKRSFCGNGHGGRDGGWGRAAAGGEQQAGEGQDEQ